MDLTEAEDIKKRWQEYTKELYKKDLHDPDLQYPDGVITHLEPDILECEEDFQGNETTHYATIMVDTCHYVLVKTHRAYNTKSEP